MASGHVNRANRPNTWLRRPALQREETPCQPGSRHFCDLARSESEGRFQPGSGCRRRPYLSIMCLATRRRSGSPTTISPRSRNRRLSSWFAAAWSRSRINCAFWRSSEAAGAEADCLPAMDHPVPSHGAAARGPGRCERTSWGVGTDGAVAIFPITVRRCHLGERTPARSCPGSIL